MTDVLGDRRHWREFAEHDRETGQTDGVWADRAIRALDRVELLEGTPRSREEIIEATAGLLEASRWEELGEFLADVIIRVNAQNPEHVAGFLTGSDYHTRNKIGSPWEQVRTAMEHHLIEFPGVIT